MQTSCEFLILIIYIRRVFFGAYCFEKTLAESAAIFPFFDFPTRQLTLPTHNFLSLICRINKLLETGSAIHEELSCVVIDELHLIGDAERGYQLELLLTKLRYHA